MDIEDNAPLSYPDNYFNLKFQREQLIQREVDLLKQKAINSSFLQQQIEKNKVLVYGRFKFDHNF
ncbi:hypothetical protein [Cyclobacterium roseum]|uniref:hypothetical protein n=1 Tax=Cyclobacterium roseum TaxID=2666137 RepID=UPI001F187F2A|nr:hypothetical protein [Cyclobacterium roseum]